MVQTTMALQQTEACPATVTCRRRFTGSALASFCRRPPEEVAGSNDSRRRRCGPQAGVESRER